MSRVKNPISTQERTTASGCRTSSTTGTVTTSSMHAAIHDESATSPAGHRPRAACECAASCPHRTPDAVSSSATNRVPLRPQPVTTNRSSSYGRQHPAQLGDPLHLCAPPGHVLIRPQLLRPLPRPPAGRLVWPRHGQGLQRPPPPAQILTVHEDPCLAQVLLQPW